MFAESSYYKYQKIFSPEGRLYQVEYAQTAVKSVLSSSVLLTSKTHSVVLSHHPQIDPLSVRTFRSVFRVNESVLVSVAGLSADCCWFVNWLQRVASNFFASNNHAAPIEHLVGEAAKLFQNVAHYNFIRTFAVEAFFISSDKPLTIDGCFERAAYQLRPGCRAMPVLAACVGKGSDKGKTELEKIVESKTDFEKEELLFAAFNTLKKMVGKPLTGDEIEIGITQEGKAQILSREEGKVLINHIVEERI